MARLVLAGGFVGPGEERAARYLEKNLPNPWVVICNKELLNPNGSPREVDFIVVGKHVVFVVEEKSWAGPIHGNDNGWVLRSGESFASPLTSAESCARRLAGLLRNNVPGLGVAVTGHFVFSRVLLTADEVQVFVHDPRVPEQVLRLQGCEEDLERFDRLQATTSSISVFRASIVDRLTGLTDRPKVPRRVGDYDIIESLPSEGPIRCLRGKHRDGTIRLLKLLERPTTVDPDRRESHENALLREYDTLRKLEATGRAPKVDPYFSWEQDYYWVLPVHLVEGKSLRADAADALPAEVRIWAILEEAFSALAEIHQAGVVHRALSPDRVHVSPHAKVLFSDFLIARIEGEKTVAAQAQELDGPNVYAAPECRVDPGLAEPQSDVYSLAASLFFWATGCEPGASEGTFSSLRSDLPEEAAAALEEVFSRCMVEDERARLGADQALTLIKGKREKTLEARSQGPGPREMEPGTIVEDQYRILRILGEGATAVTYLAEDLVAESVFVLKTIRNPELVAKLSRAEFRCLVDLVHPNLPRVYDIRPPGSHFHLKIEYIRGSPLRDVMTQHLGDIRFCLRLGEQVLSALKYLGERGMIHRDISASNILVPDEETGLIRLIDFGLATVKSESTSAVGTPLYRAPEVGRGGTWTAACDVYSLAVVLFQTLTGRLPYVMKEGVPHKDQLVAPTDDETRKLDSRLLRCLIQGVSPDPRSRFQTATHFDKALRATQVDLGEPSPIVAQGANPFVDALRSVYRNSRKGNAGNRGLDDEFAVQTYVPTRLDTDLLPRLVQGQYRLAVLCGNPGDGKTAFLQQCEGELGKRQATLERKDASGWCMRLGNRTFVGLYDASKSNGGRSADSLLDEVLRPLAGDGSSDESYTVVIAVNDGRLIDFFERKNARYPWLWDSLRAQLFEAGGRDSAVTVVDLKRRALVGYEPEQVSIFSRVLDEFLAEHRWTECQECGNKAECPIYFNILSLRDPAVGAKIRGQLGQVLLAAHLRRERRPTVRDLRSALAFIITHDLGCQDIHAKRQAGELAVSDLSFLYYNSAFDGSGSPDLLLDEWARMDPGQVASPKLDRFLFFHREPSQWHRVEAIFRKVPGRLNRLPPPEDWLAQLKRRYFFEGDYSPDRETAVELPDPDTLLPYRHFGRFKKSLKEQPTGSELLGDLLTGISRVDGVPASVCNRGLALRVVDSDVEDVIVVKRYPIEEFQVRRPVTGAAFVEEIGDELILAHKDGFPNLAISLDLFELVLRAEQGFLPGPDEQKALAEDLAIFKNQLLARPAQEVAIIEGGHRIHGVRVESGRIRREEVLT